MQLSGQYSLQIYTKGFALSQLGVPQFQFVDFSVDETGYLRINYFKNSNLNNRNGGGASLARRMLRSDVDDTLGDLRSHIGKHCVMLFKKTLGGLSNLLFRYLLPGTRIRRVLAFE